jgi:histidinol-phosphate aminotransferase
LARITANENVARLVPYVAGKPIEEVERELGITDIVKLASNESPIGPSPLALEAAQTALQNIRMYPEGSCYVLRSKLAEHLGVPENMLMFGNGSDDLLHNLGLSFLQSTDEVVTGAPTFSQYRAACNLAGATMREAPLRNYTFDLDALADLFNEKTRMVFVANPNNPTGTMNTAAEVERLLDRLPERALLILDEAYYEYVESGDYPDSIQYVRDGRNVVVLRTFSKIYALAGLRVGYGIADPAIVRYIDQVREPFNVNSVAQYAAAASLDDPGQVKRNREITHAGKELLAAAFEQMGLDYAPSQANFVFVDFGRDSMQICDDLMRRGVIIRPGKPFGTPTCARVTIGTQEENERFLRALKEVLG